MAGKDFQKGNPGGPGRGPGWREDNMVSQLTDSAFRIVASQYILMPYRDLIALQERAARSLQESRETNDTDVTTLEMALMMTLVRSIRDGDIGKLEPLLSRLMGKPPDRVVISGPNGDPIQAKVFGMSEDELQKRWNELRQRLGPGESQGDS